MDVNEEMTVNRGKGKKKTYFVDLRYIRIRTRRRREELKLFLRKRFVSDLNVSIATH